MNEAKPQDGSTVKGYLRVAFLMVLQKPFC